MKFHKLGFHEFVKKKSVALASFCKDHSPIGFFSLELKDMILWAKGLWKFNNSLTSKAKSCVNTLCILDQANITDKQLYKYIFTFMVSIEILHIFQKHLKNKKQCVRINGTQSYLGDIISGACQR